MAQTKEGALKLNALRYGLTVEEYQAKLKNGLSWCRRCKAWLDVANFGIDRSRANGLAKLCFGCRYKAGTPNSPSIRERKTKRSLGFSWCSGHKEWISSAQTHAGLCKECKNRQYRELYKGKAGFAIRQRVYARKRKIEALPLEAREALLDHYGNLCLYCQVKKATTYDHIWPVKLGGRTIPGNIVPACVSCNSSKGETLLIDWLEKKGFAESDLLFDAISLFLISVGGVTCLRELK